MTFKSVDIDLKENKNQMTTAQVSNGARFLKN